MLEFGKLSYVLFVWVVDDMVAGVAGTQVKASNSQTLNQS